MKFEKRADGGDVTPASSGTPDTGKKPVIVYILILFLAAFLLMFLSMLSHRVRHPGDPDQPGAGH